MGIHVLCHCPRQVSYVSSLYLLKLLPTNVEWEASSSLRALHVLRPVSDNIWEFAEKGRNQQEGERGKRVKRNKWVQVTENLNKGIYWYKRFSLQGS